MAVPYTTRFCLCVCAYYSLNLNLIQAGHELLKSFDSKMERNPVKPVRVFSCPSPHSPLKSAPKADRLIVCNKVESGALWSNVLAKITMKDKVSKKVMIWRKSTYYGRRENKLFFGTEEKKRMLRVR